MKIRERIFNIIEASDGDDKLSTIYDYFMIVIIIASLIPLAFKIESPFFEAIDNIAVAFFIIDYCFRWATADYKFDKHSISSFIRYPFSFMAIVDLVSILPSLRILNDGFKVLRVLRMMRALRVLRVFKTFRYSKSIQLIADVFKKSKDSLVAVGSLAFVYILISALMIFNVEPESFDTFFDALYWATVSLTTVGYGDIYPVTNFGRVITMISSLFGIAIVALPSGIITAGYIERLSELKKHKENNDIETV